MEEKLMTERFQDIAVNFTQAAAHFLWQGAAIGLIAWALAKAFRGRPNQRHTVHLLALGALAVCLPINLAFLSSDAPTAAMVEVLPAENSATQPILDGIALTPGSAAAGPPIPATVEIQPAKTQIDWWSAASPWVVSAYLLGLCLMSLRLWFSFAHVRKLRSDADPVEEPEWSRALVRLCERFNLRTAPALKWSARVAGPVVIGLIKPAILLPISLSLQLSMRQAEIVLAHELAHLRRRDPWIVIFQRVVETILFFHPAMWWVSRQLEKAREEACDDLVVSKGTDPADYAEALVRCSELRLAESATGSDGRIAEKSDFALVRAGCRLRCQAGARWLAGGRDRGAWGDYYRFGDLSSCSKGPRGFRFQEPARWLRSWGSPSQCRSLDQGRKSGFQARGHEEN
ncbi:MAG: beta-lactamase regulating signal transducer with metallopeptidase domain [Verrucomicrobiales bacterium]|jgi:beta-lactamase regulating signal transducer with metallopeptidase domain